VSYKQSIGKKCLETVVSKEFRGRGTGGEGRECLREKKIGRE
jgi:hypothetical protein